jgi:phosphoribosylformimino-5-aminoimidazole carboxamide ribotide isomerase
MFGSFRAFRGYAALTTTIGHKIGAGGNNRPGRAKKMQLLPVLDVMGGQVVRGIGGRRDQYRPIVSRLTYSTRPLDVARALRAHLGLAELYLADLDAIMGGAPALETYQTLQGEGFRLWVDAGLCDATDARPLAEVEVATIVAGLETLAGPEALERLCQNHGSERVVFSLDLKAGLALGKADAWSSSDPMKLAASAIAIGVRRLLVLDLTHVGMGTGTGTERLCSQLAAAFPDVQLAAGGGVASMEDLDRLAGCGVQDVLVASALHDGRITKLTERARPPKGGFSPTGS